LNHQVEEAKELVRLCRTGRLHDVEKWIADGKPLVYTEKSGSWPIDKQQGHREWIEWASRQADRLDPFVLKKPSSVVDRKGELGRQW
jgi:hypothetical protein